jgi:hypothetical protein
METLSSLTRTNIFHLGLDGGRNLFVRQFAEELQRSVRQINVRLQCFDHFGVISRLKNDTNDPKIQRKKKTREQPPKKIIPKRISGWTTCFTM